MKRSTKKKRKLKDFPDSYLPMEIAEARAEVRRCAARLDAAIENLALVESELIERWKAFLLTRPTKTSSENSHL